MKRIRLAAVILGAAIVGGTLASGSAHAVNSTGFVPLNDLGTGTYLGFQGGLYENGTNAVPSDHASAGSARTALVQPLDASGNPNASGKVVLLSVGMSNTTQEFCSASSAPPCDGYTLMGQASVDPAVNHSTLVIVNGAAGGQAATTWDSPADPNYDRVRDTRLVPAGVSEQQVQAVWLKVANPNPTVSLPAAGADAYQLETSMGNIVRALKVRYPNVRLVFVSSRIYAGYATTTLNPEPYAYESGFAVKWLIQAQIDQMRNGGSVVDARAGDLNDNSVAPWIAWAPYLWADGVTPRSDGLTWVQSDFVSDGTHPSPSGRQKVATMLLNFFKTSPFATPWFACVASGADNDAAPSFPWIKDGVGPEGATTGPDPCDPNDDNSGCLDAAEVGANHLLGGDRDPFNPWDFADMWTPALPAAGSRNGSVTLADVASDLAWVGTKSGGAPNGTGRQYDSDTNGNGVADGAEYDRTASTAPGKPWRSGTPSGAVTLSDVSVVLASVGDHC